MSAAQPIMRISHVEESAISYTKPAKRDTTIRDTVNQFAKLSPVAKAILTEVVELHMKAGKELCYASNEQLAAAAHCHEKSVSRHLRDLLAARLLTVDYPKRDNRFRVLTPSAEVLESCTSGDPTPCNLVLQALVTRCYEGGNRVLQASPPGVTLLHSTSEKDIDELRSNNISLQAANDAARAAEELLKAEIERLKEQLLVWEDTAKENGRLHAEEVVKRQDAEAGREADRAAARRVVAGRDKIIAELKEQLEAKPKRKAAAPVKPRRDFEPPTKEQMLAYMLEQRPHNPRADVVRVADKCFGYYMGNGWMVGRNPMKDWKGGCQTFLADLPKIAPKPEEPTTPIAQRTGLPTDAQRETLRLKNQHLATLR